MVTITPSTLSTSPPSKITDDSLRRWNIILGFLHLFNGIALLVGVLVVPGLKDFRINLTQGYQAYNETTKTLFTDYRDVGAFNPGWFLPVFFLITSFYHFSLATYARKQYVYFLERRENPFRWDEYAMTSSLMIIVIAMFFGVNDVTQLMLIFAANAAMNFFGTCMETTQVPGKTVDWKPFFFGSFVGLVPWIVIFFYFFSNPNGIPEGIPPFVYGILVTYICFFFSFAINMLLSYTQVGGWRDYRVGEKGYMLLSLVSKTLLGWSVFAGLFQPNN
nr:heliorhodopsin [Sicyoidochytrium minutum DNA virus]